MTLRKLLLATDLTPRDDRAFDRAVQIASSGGSELTMLYVVNDELLPAPYVRQNIQDATDALHRQVEEAGLTPDLNVSVEVATGRPYKAIIATAQRDNADLIILGSPHGDSVMEAFLGTTVDHVVRYGPCPVLLVRSRPRKPYRDILVATDLSMPSRRALEFALRSFPEAKFSVVHASPSKAPDAASSGPDKRQSGDEQLVRDMVTACVAQLTGEKALQPGDVEVIVDHGAAADVVFQQVKRRNPQLVVVGSHGRTGASHVLLGSVAQKLLEVLPCDVLAVRP
jgi:nucleotide-binding universal stress UspA family protein